LLWWLTPVILATREAEIRRIAVEGQSRQIVCKPHLSMPVIPTMWGGTNRIMGQAALGIKGDPISKITKAKGLGTSFK
jgi:hypothetical protein